jgi:hypothetical protein
LSPSLQRKRPENEGFSSFWSSNTCLPHNNSCVTMKKISLLLLLLLPLLALAEHHVEDPSEQRRQRKGQRVRRRANDLVPVVWSSVRRVFVVCSKLRVGWAVGWLTEVLQRHTTMTALLSPLTLSQLFLLILTRLMS